MRYVMGYSVSALFFLCILTVHFLNSRQIRSRKNRLLAGLLVGGSLWISLDILFRCIASYISVLPKEWLFLMSRSSCLFFGIQFFITLFLRKYHTNRAGVISAHVLAGVSLFLQRQYPGMLFSNVGIAVSVSVLYFSFGDQDRMLDPAAGCFNTYGLREFWEDGIGKSKICCGMAVLSKESAALETAEGLLKLAGNGLVFRLNRQMFLVLWKKAEKRDREQRTPYSKRMQRETENWLKRDKIEWIGWIEELEGTEMGEKLPDFLRYAAERKKELLDGTLWEEFKRQSELECYLQKAIEEKLFFMEYQPIWSVKEKRFDSLEALARLNHPRYGRISPGEFIPLAENMGISGGITACVLELVTDFMREPAFQALEIRQIKVNLSAADFQQEDLWKRIEALLLKKELAPGKLALELTETAASLGGAEIRENFRRLGELPVELIMDDFGSGYANLETVIQLNFNTVKIDRSMLTLADSSEKSRNLYRNMVHMLKELGLSVVAEGAETEEQVRRLEAWKVDDIQGFYFSKPLTREEVLEKFKK